MTAIYYSSWLTGQDNMTRKKFNLLGSSCRCRNYYYECSALISRVPGWEKSYKEIGEKLHMVAFLSHYALLIRIALVW